MGMLNEVEVDINAPPLDPYRDDDLEGGEDAEGGDEEEEDDDDEDITEIQEEAFTRVRSSNYTDAEDILLVRAWASVGLDAGTGTDQTGKRYWQRIEDAYLKMKPKRSGFASRSFRSLQGRWDLMKPACARWSAAMDQVMDAPPSGTVESDYVSLQTSHRMVSLMCVVWFLSCVLYGFSHVCCVCCLVCRRRLPA
jgi:hypothetical protein